MKQDLTNLNLAVGLISAISGTLALVTDLIKDPRINYFFAALLIFWLLVALVLQAHSHTSASSASAIRQPSGTLLKYLFAALLILVIIAIFLFKFTNIATSSQDNTVLRIDDVPSSIYSYQFTNAYTITYGILQVENNGESGLAYNLEFDSTDGYSNDVGLAFGFNQKQNISIYRKLQFTIEFSVDSMDRKVYLMDVYKNKIFVDLKKYNPGIEQTTTRDGKQLFKISLNENFNGIDLKEVTGVYFLTSTETRSGSKKDYFQVQDVRFSND